MSHFQSFHHRKGSQERGISGEERRGAVQDQRVCTDVTRPGKNYELEG